MAKCESTTKDGRPCQAPASDGGYCFWHDPTRREQAQLARVRGGLNRRTGFGIGVYPEEVRNAGDILAVQNALLLDILEMENSERRSRLLISLTEAMGNTIALQDLSSRLQTVERGIYAFERNIIKSD